MMVYDIKNSDKKSFNTRRRTILYLIHKYLNEFGYADIATSIKQEALLNEYEICDNIDLDIIFLEYCSYHQMKFGKIPDILKKIPLEKFHLSDTPNNNSSNKGKKSIKNLHKKTVTEISETLLNNADNLNATLSIKQIENQNFNIPQCLKSTIIAEVPSEWKEFLDIISKTVVRKNLKYSFKDVIGNKEAIATIKEAVLLPIEIPLIFENELKPWKSLLLYGPPGCGKTLIAKALCSEIQDTISFFNINSSIIISKWRGDSEKILSTLFEVAQNMAPSVIFFDEIECLCGRRNSTNEHEASHRLKSEFLTLLDGIQDTAENVFILANTNLPWQIDEAFLRRFEKKILIKLPTENERLELFNMYLAESKNWSNKSLEDIKKLSENFTGDEIRIACKEYKMKSIRKLIDNTKNNKKKLNVNCISVNSANNKKESNIDPDSLIEILKKMKPNSLKLYEKHYQWQQEIGAINEN